MEKRKLGSSDLHISAIGVGCMNFGSMCDQSTTTAIIDQAFELGINFFDVADIYGGRMGLSESMLGKALGSRRREAVVATKFGATLGSGGGAGDGRGTAAYIVTAVDHSLRSLGTDYIDLYQHHFPDPTTLIDETLRALDDLVSAGKVRHIGCSNYSAAQLTGAMAVAEAAGLKRFVSAQNRYSLITRDVEAELQPACLRFDVGILPYFPLESGLLTGKYRQGEPLPADSRFAKWRGGGSFASEARYQIVARLERCAQRLGRSVLDLSIGWLAAQPAVTSVIAGVTRPAQLAQNAAAGSWRPTPEQLAEIRGCVDSFSTP